MQLVRISYKFKMKVQGWFSVDPLKCVIKYNIYHTDIEKVVFVIICTYICTSKCTIKNDQ